MQSQQDQRPPVVLVTGSARGLGLAVARRLARDGARVHVVWRTSGERARALEDEFEGRAHRCDLTDWDQTRRLVETVLGLEGRIDAVVHAVGDFRSGPLTEVDAADLAGLFESNVGSAWNLVRAGREALRESRGAWVFFGLAGLAGLRARRSSAAYAAVKSALAVLVRSLAVEEGPHGVRANLVSPGIVPHPGAHPDTLAARGLDRVPLGRVGSPGEVAAAVAWLLSDEASYVTGQDLEVSGGFAL